MQSWDYLKVRLMVRGTSARPVDGQILRKEEGVLEGCMEGRGDG